MGDGGRHQTGKEIISIARIRQFYKFPNGSFIASYYGVITVLYRVPAIFIVLFFYFTPRLLRPAQYPIQLL